MFFIAQSETISIFRTNVKVLTECLCTRMLSQQIIEKDILHKWKVIYLFSVDFRKKNISSGNLIKKAHKRQSCVLSKEIFRTHMVKAYFYQYNFVIFSRTTREFRDIYKQPIDEFCDFLFTQLWHDEFQELCRWVIGENRKLSFHARRIFHFFSHD